MSLGSLITYYSVGQARLKGAFLLERISVPLYCSTSTYSYVLLLACLMTHRLVRALTGRLTSHASALSRHRLSCHSELRRMIKKMLNSHIINVTVLMQVPLKLDTVSYRYLLRRDMSRCRQRFCPFCNTIVLQMLMSMPVCHSLFLRKRTSQVLSIWS